MRSKLFLRVAAVLLLVHFLGHSMGHFSWDKPKDPKKMEVVNAMKGYRSEFMGANRSMADYYNGYSIIMFFVFGMMILLLWNISGLVESNPAILRGLLYPICLALISFAAIEYLYFFLFAAGISLLAGFATIAAILSLKKN